MYDFLPRVFGSTLYKNSHLEFFLPTVKKYTVRESPPGVLPPKGFGSTLCRNSYLEFFLPLVKKYTAGIPTWSSSFQG
jgi:hypothetical protein